MKNNESFFLNGYKHDTVHVVDCQIMLLRDICSTLGAPISGEMCFGISEGYSFEYWLDRSSKIPCLIMLGRSLKLAPRFMDKIGIVYNTDTVSTEDEFEKYTEEKLRANHVPIVFADRYYLRYLEKIYNRAHFGNHVFSISGMKKENDEVSYALCDILSDEPVWCSSGEIQMARNSLWKPFSPDCKVIDVDLNKSNVDKLKNDLPQMILDSVNNTADFMLTEQKAGVNAIAALASEVKGLLEADLSKLSRALAFQMRLLASFIREFEETHSFYRMTYAAFLEEASDKYGLGDLMPYSMRIREIGKKWTSMSELIISDEPIDELLNEFSLRLNKTSELERDFFTELKQTIQKSGLCQ